MTSLCRAVSIFGNPGNSVLEVGISERHGVRYIKPMIGQDGIDYPISGSGLKLVINFLIFTGFSFSDYGTNIYAISGKRWELQY